VDVIESSRRASHIVTRTQQMFTNRPLQKRLLNLNDPIRDILEIAEAQVRWCDVALEVTLDESLPLVFADSVQIQQVLLNLIMNGLDAMEGVTGSPRVLQISSRRRGRGAVVSVRDAGTGFHPQDASRLFTPFFTTKAGGTGMGLTISQSIIKKHGGSLWGVANTDRGATFRFRIPAH
jgi:C4-dicarboxylate-specific signal transduction histidine kinase